ncbi:complex I subunit 5 family protein [Phycisphaerales bacterium AB-hyl4]|uniref:Complex I subunit 5 family protein n=1 Tax=Natronomicrosphaera hydrolytica TaxID=3242702 RepID=A0ABV4U7T2_9BACT
MASLWLLILGLPVVVALMLSADEPTRRLARVLAPWVAWPAVVLSLAWPTDLFARADWWLLGGAFGLDGVGRLFALLVSTLWLIAGFYASAYMRDNPKHDVFWMWFLLAMTGNLGLVVSFDVASFYLFFTLMTFAAFGLVALQGDSPSLFAGKVYIAMSVAGEAVLLVGLLRLAATLPDLSMEGMAEHVLVQPGATLTMVLLLVGFGVKAGLFTLHMWLPLAHPAAPTPASAVLSGAMIKAGVLGWLRFFPGGVEPMVAFGAVMVGFGLAGAIVGVLFGLVQRDPKSNLAYSSVSQVGFMTVGVGLGLMEPTLWPTAVVVVALYAMHHGLAKAALFLAVGVAMHGGRGGWRTVGLYAGVVVAALSLAGMPLSSGYLAKMWLKDLGGDLPHAWLGWVELLLPIAAVGTTLLMGRLFWLLRREHRNEEHDYKQGLWGPWLVLLALVVGMTWVTPTVLRLEPTGVAARPEFAWDAMWAAFWPVGLGLLLLMAMVWRGVTIAWWMRVPPGDALVIVRWGIDLMRRPWEGVVIPASTRLSESAFAMRNYLLLKVSKTMAVGEIVLVRWGAGGIMFILLILVLALAVVMGRGVGSGGL